MRDQNLGVFDISAAGRLSITPPLYNSSFPSSQGVVHMAVQTASGQAQCPECFADVTLNKVMQNEITQCPGCGAELEITALEPLTLALAPQEEEDWGE
jgi:alpha-aminoadipate/glutamate carrier protein LysW